MPRLIKTCPVCSSPANFESEVLFGDEKMTSLKCGHSYVEKVSLSLATVYDSIESEDGQKPYPFQIEGVRFAEKSGGKIRVLIADEMGLGKTVQALTILRLHPELLPAVILTKSTLKYQWMSETIRWCYGGRDLSYIPAVITKSNEKPNPFFKITVISIDLIRSLKWPEDQWPKTVIIDECQSIKNQDSKRAYYTREFCSHADSVIALSGTPIKNHAGEFFTILNILRPDKFPSFKQFLARWVDFYTANAGPGIYKTKIGGIKPYLVKEWQDFTKDFIIRRTRAEVLPDLPKIRRTLQKVEFEDHVIEGYKRVMKEFLKEFDENGITDKNMMHILAYISRMRHITGISKINAAVDWIKEFLESTDRKLVVFYHHKDVAELIAQALQHEIETSENGIKGIKIIHTKSDQDKEYQGSLENQFKNDPLARVLIASTLASGEGKNWQFCEDALMLERQWNSVNEEQAEGRFSRIGATHSYVNVSYLTVLESIDEYFADLIDEKRQKFYQTMDGREASYDEQSITRELANILSTKGRKAWKL